MALKYTQHIHIPCYICRICVVLSTFHPLAIELHVFHQPNFFISIVINSLQTLIIINDRIPQSRYEQNCGYLTRSKYKIQRHRF